MSAWRLAFVRLVRSRRARLAVGAWVLFAVATAIVERTRAWPSAGHALVGPFGAFALPLLAYTLVGGTLGGTGLATAARPIVSFGGAPRRVTISFVAVAIAASVALSGLLSALVAAVAHGPDDPAVVVDALKSLEIGALAGGAYAAYFALGSALFKNGAGRGALLVVDFLFGGGISASSLLTPRAHLRSLFGGAPVLELSQRASMAALVVLLAAFGALAVARAGRAAAYRG